MLIEREKFTESGDECNKIGVGFNAFQLQSSRCQSSIGDCLKNQIYDYYTEDVEKLLAGKPTKYILKSSGKNFKFFQGADNSKVISEELTGIFSTLLTLELVADDIEFTVNRSLGEIDSVEIKPFESNSNQGFAFVQITNIGTLAAEYALSFLCSIGIVEITESGLFLEPLESTTIKKQITTKINSNSTHHCNVTLSDSIGFLTDWEYVSFNTTFIELVTDTGQDWNGSTNPDIEEKEFFSCFQVCPNPFDFICFVGNSCWGSLFLGIFLLSIPVAAFFIIYKVCRWYCRKKRRELRHTPEETPESECEGDIMYVNLMDGYRKQSMAIRVIPNCRQPNEILFPKRGFEFMRSFSPKYNMKRIFLEIENGSRLVTKRPRYTLVTHF